MFLRRLFSFAGASNIEGIDRGRAWLAEHADPDLVNDVDREVQAVRELRVAVPSLGLLDAVRLVREARRV